MKSQLIVSIGREHGSGGHFVAQMLAERLNVKLYDHELLQKIAERGGYTEEVVEKLDEKPVNFLTSRKVGEFSNSPQATVAEHTFNIIREAAQSGESFVVVGRCAEFVLRETPGLLRIFVCGDEENKIERLMKTDNVGRTKAIELMHSVDKKRRAYHDYYCDTRWGFAPHYDLTINSSKLGLEATADVLAAYAQYFRNM
jgi:cytidylate kinase